MKTILLTSFIIGFLFQQINFAQDTTETSLKESAFALQFQVSNNFTLKDFQGTTLSCKYHFYDRTALRLGIEVSGSVSNKIDGQDVETNLYESFSFTINTQLIHYLNGPEDVFLFFGGGPFYSRTLYNSAGIIYDDNYWSVGISGVLGAEWFFKNNMSLNAEYGLSFFYGMALYYNSSEGSYKTRSFGIRDQNNLKFGLSVYL